MAMAPRNCKGCGEEFAPKRNFQTFCETCKPKAASAPRRPPAPAIDIEALVKQAVAEALARPAEQSAPSSPDGLQEIMSKLAITLGNYQNQFSGQQLVPADILAAREHNQRLMHEAIAELQSAIRNGENVEIPRYRLVAKIIGPLMNGDEIIEPVRRQHDNTLAPTELNWPLAPNLAMVPINDAAHRIFALFKGSISNQSPRDAQKDGDRARPPMTDDTYIVTHGGRVVTAGSQTQSLRNVVRTNDGPMLTPDRSGRLAGQEPNRIHSGPPTIQVRVLGTIAPPAVQNG